MRAGRKQRNLSGCFWPAAARRHRRLSAKSGRLTYVIFQLETVILPVLSCLTAWHEQLARRARPRRLPSGEPIPNNELAAGSTPSITSSDAYD